MAKNALYFIQDYILDHPNSNKKSGAYLAILSDIKHNLSLTCLPLFIFVVLYAYFQLVIVPLNISMID